MSRLDDNKYFIIFLQKTKSLNQRRSVLKYATRGQILTLSELVANYLHGNIELANLNNYKTFVKNRHLFRILGYTGRKSWIKRKQAAIDLGKVLIKFLLDIRIQENEVQ